MKIKDSNKFYFYFTFEKEDLEKYTYLKCQKFLNVIKKEIPIECRYYIQKMNTWAIHKKYRAKINELLTNYFNFQPQEKIFNE